MTSVTSLTYCQKPFTYINNGLRIHFFFVTHIKIIYYEIISDLKVQKITNSLKLLRTCKRNINICSSSEHIIILYQSAWKPLVCFTFFFSCKSVPMNEPAWKVKSIKTNYFIFLQLYSTHLSGQYLYLKSWYETLITNGLHKSSFYKIWSIKKSRIFIAHYNYVTNNYCALHWKT